jgi:hypothetical protein
MEKNSKGRTIHTGPKGGRYVLEGGKKIYKFTPAAVVASSNTNVNSKGRPIYTGPKGGRYVLEGGKKIYKFTPGTAVVARKTVSPGSNTNVNSKGRPIYTGPKGGRYVLEGGKKIYKFTPAAPRKTVSVPPPIEMTNRVKRRLVKLLSNVRRRRIAPITTGFKTKDVDLIFDIFDTVNPMKEMKTYKYNLKVSVPHGDSQLVNMIKEGSVLGITEDTLPPQSWITAQGNYLKSLNEYDLYTAMSYTVRSHQWIGPWLRGQKRQAIFTKPNGHTLPLYFQVMKLAEKSKELWALDLLKSSNPYETYRWMNLNQKVIDAAIELYVKDLQRIIKGAPPLPKTIYVYRGLLSDIFKKKIGSVHKFGEFASAGYVPQRVYATNSYMRIKLLKGTRVLLLQGLNHWTKEGEFEIVINKGSHYVIRKRGLNRYAFNVRTVRDWYKPKNTVTDVTVYN